MVTSLRIGGGDSVIDEAAGYYKIAVNRDFTWGRRTLQLRLLVFTLHVGKMKIHTFLLIFQNIYSYLLGALFLQLCKLLRLEQHDYVQKLVDPSLFNHRFTEQNIIKKDSRLNLEETVDTLKCVGVPEDEMANLERQLAPAAQDNSTRRLGFVSA